MARVGNLSALSPERDFIYPNLISDISLIGKFRATTSFLEVLEKTPMELKRFDGKGCRRKSEKFGGLISF